MRCIRYRATAGTDTNASRPMVRREAAGAASPLVLIDEGQVDSIGTPRFDLIGYQISVSAAENVQLEMFSGAASLVVSVRHYFAAAGSVVVTDLHEALLPGWGLRATKEGAGAWDANVEIHARVEDKTMSVILEPTT